MAISSSNQPVVRCGIYSSAHVLAPQKKEAVERIEAGESIKLLKFMIEEATPAESLYRRLLTLLSTQGQHNRHDLLKDLAKARQKLNHQISLRKDTLARILGLTEREFTRSYLPRDLEGMWCCNAGDAFTTPVDFLRHQLALRCGNSNSSDAPFIAIVDTNPQEVRTLLKTFNPISTKVARKS